MKNVSCEYNREWLKLNFASCVVHQTRSYNKYFEVWFLWTKPTCALSALELFFCDFSAARPRFVATLARSDSPQSPWPCPRADPPSPRPSRSASEVARSRLRGLPHASQAQPCFFATTCLLGSSYSPTVTLFLFWSLSGSRPS